jgi:hypothetical protein
MIPAIPSMGNSCTAFRLDALPTRIAETEVRPMLPKVLIDIQVGADLGQEGDGVRINTESRAVRIISCYPLYNLNSVGAPGGP